jgi:hypothetical protein
MKALLIVGPVAACVLSLAACGTAGNPAPPPQGAAAVPTACGVLPAAGGTTKAFVREGAVPCDEAKSLLARYFAQLTPADLANPNGAGPVPLGAWTCGSNPGAPLSATCSTEDDRQIAASPA